MDYPIQPETARFTPGSPAARGFRMPAEWEPHEGTWITWPHFEGTWPGKLDAVVPIYVEIARALHTGEAVHINVLDEAAEGVVRELLRLEGVEGNVHLHRVPTDNEWVRDYGAIFVVRDDDGGRARLATDWGFNNWGEKYPDFALDNRVPDRMADILGTPIEAHDFILEGGSIEVNGKGTLLTTESCLLNPNRNPDATKEDIERRLRDTFGVHDIVWLGDGIVGDDTDGHIDDLTRFVGPDTVVTVVEEDPDDENYGPLQENLDRLRTLDRFEIVTLPMPAPVVWDGHRLPASYANFYIGNRVVLLPAFDDPADAEAQATMQHLFPNRTVVPIDCRDLVWGLGAFHCLTQQVPAASAG
jgi:agmatine deiminase